MELKVGMYVRKKNGRIGKIIEVSNKRYKNDDYIRLDIKNSIYDVKCTENNIKKSSYDIIDLIEVGDIVVGKDGHNFEVYAVGGDCVYINELSQFILIDEIEEVVTHEQFKSILYKLD